MLFEELHGELQGHLTELKQRIDDADSLAEATKLQSIVFFFNKHLTEEVLMKVSQQREGTGGRGTKGRGKRGPENGRDTEREDAGRSGRTRRSLSCGSSSSTGSTSSCR